MQDQTGFMIELVYFLCLFLLPIAIYVRTRKIYAFSQHEGIKYFRNAFVFFSLIYLFRFVVLALPSAGAWLDAGTMTSVEALSMFLVIYFSLLSIFYLAASFAWKDLRFISDSALHLTSLFLASVIYFIKLPVMLLVFGLIIIIFLALKAYFNYKYKNRKIFTRLYGIYALLLVFWLFDLVPYTQQLLGYPVKIVGYILSVIVFIYINYKIKTVLKDGAVIDKKKE